MFSRKLRGLDKIFEKKYSINGIASIVRMIAAYWEMF